MRHFSDTCNFFSIYKLSICLLTSFILFACQSNEQANTQTKEENQKAQEVQKKKKEQEKKLLSQGDLVERLTAYEAENPEDTVIIHTDLGDITLRLYKETPLHRANFIRLVKRGFYDETMFHRVVPGFVMQGGGTDIYKKVKVGKYRIPAEIMPEQYIHKRGAVAMARYDEDNPNKQSDSHEFYIVWGEDFNQQTLAATAQKYGLKLSAMQKQVYLKEGGSPHLDGLYTVFGEVIDGLEVVDKVCHLEVDKRGWPLTNVSIKMEW